MLARDAKPQAGLVSHSLSRRNFLKFCGLMASTLALPARYAPRIANALTASPRLPVIWLEFQDCTGDSESFLRASRRPHPITSPMGGMPGTTPADDPALVDMLFDHISLDYHETLMAPAGKRSEKSRQDTLEQHRGQYLCVVEGSIPSAANGAYCTIGGRSALSIAQEFCTNARAVIAVGNCGWDSGLAAAAPNPSRASGVKDAVPGLANLVNLPGCPVNVVNLAATIVHLITFNELPPRDSLGRPNFAYGSLIHHRCPRLTHFMHGHFVREWGDAGTARAGACTRWAARAR